MRDNEAGQKKSPHQVFLVGCPRSGTTLLQSLLAAHPNIVSFPESQFFLYLFKSNPSPSNSDRSFISKAVEHVRQLVSRKLIFGEHLKGLRSRLTQFLQDSGQPDLIEKFPSGQLLLKSQGTKAFVKILNAIALQQDKTLWLEKTPQHLYYIDHITKQVPQAKFIHLFRNGVDVVASLYDVRQKYPQAWPDEPADVHLCVQRWLRDAKLSLRYLGRPNHYFVRYEDLVSQPEQVLEGLCEFMGLAYSSNMLEAYSSATQQVILASEPWKNSVSREIRNQNSTKFAQLFTPEEQQYICDRVKQVDLEQLLVPHR